ERRCSRKFLHLISFVLGGSGVLSIRHLRKALNVIRNTTYIVVTERTELKLNKMENEQKLKKGDVLKLKSGGTKMTVLKSEFCIVTLTYFENDILKNASFDEDMLELIEKTNED